MLERDRGEESRRGKGRKGYSGTSRAFILQWMWYYKEKATTPSMMGTRVKNKKENKEGGLQPKVAKGLTKLTLFIDVESHSTDHPCVGLVVACSHRCVENIIVPNICCRTHEFFHVVARAQGEQN